jgi:hypothetical protein
MKRTVALIVLGALLAGIYFAVKLLPWWALVVGVVVLFVVGKFMIGRILRNLLTLPFKAKGAVLRGATAQVNAVNSAASNAEAADTRARFEIDVTITPGNSEGNFSHWEPGELRLVATESKIDINSEADDGDVCSIDTVEIEEDGQFKADEGCKYPGAQRLKLGIAVAPGTRALKFRYYFEEFGEIRLESGFAKAA